MRQKPSPNICPFCTGPLLHDRRCSRSLCETREHRCNLCKYELDAFEDCTRQGCPRYAVSLPKSVIDPSWELFVRKASAQTCSNSACRITQQRGPEECTWCHYQSCMGVDELIDDEAVLMPRVSVPPEKPKSRADSSTYIVSADGTRTAIDDIPVIDEFEVLELDFEEVG